MNLFELKFFKDLQGNLGSLDGLEPGTPVPEGATVVGQMPQPLHELLAYNGRLVDEHNEQIIAFRRMMPGAAKGEAEVRLIAQEFQLKFIHQLFWGLLRAEYPDLGDKKHIGYGPNFEVYWSVDSEEEDDHLGSILAPLLLGGLVDIVRRAG